MTEQQYVEFLEMLTSDLFWNELRKHADKIPFMHKHLKEKFLLFEMFLPAEAKPIQRLLFSFLPSEFTHAFLTIIKLTILSDDAKNQCKILCSPKAVEATRWHAMLDLLTSRINHEHSLPHLLIHTVKEHRKILMEVLYEVGEVEKKIPAFLPNFIKRFLTSKVITLSKLLLSAFASAEIVDLYARLRPVVITYGTNDKPLLATLLLTRLLYENHSFHQELSQYLFDANHYKEIFYEIHFGLIAYNKWEFFAAFTAGFRAFNKVTNYWGIVAISSVIILSEGYIYRVPLWQSLLNIGVLSTLVVKFLQMVDKEADKNKQPLNIFYPEERRIDQPNQRMNRVFSTLSREGIFAQSARILSSQEIVAPDSTEANHI